MSQEFAKISRAVEAIWHYITEIELGETELAPFIDRAQRHCEACEQPTRDALLMTLAGIAVALMAPENGGDSGLHNAYYGNRNLE